MIIDLSNGVRINGTSSCWQLERESVTKGKACWKPYAYCVDFKAAIRRAYRDEIRTAPAHGLAEALEAAERILARYQTILDTLTPTIEDAA